MKKILTMCASVIMAAQMLAGGTLNLKDITKGLFRGQAIAAIESCSDGETYMQISANREQIVRYSYKTGKQVGVVFDVNTVRGDKIKGVDGYVISPDGRHMLIQTQTKQRYRRSFTAKYYIFETANNRMTPLAEGDDQEIPTFSPDGNVIAYVRENNIYLVKLLYGNAESQVTKDGERNKIINGIPDWVNEEEFATNKSLVFTADSRQVCWIRYDETNVKEYALSLYCGTNPSLEENSQYPGFYKYKYPIAGEENAKVKVMSFDIKSRQTREIKVPLDEEGYIPRIEATDDPTKVAVFTLNRHQDRMCIYMCNPLSTVAKLVIEEKVDKYVKEENMAATLIVGNNIVMPSDRSGHTHLYLYGINGQLKRQVTKGDYEVTDLYGLDEKTGDIYFQSNEAGITERKVYVAHANGKTDCLTPNNGVSSALFSRNFKYFVNIWSDINTPLKYDILDNKGKKTATLVDNGKLKETLSKYRLGKREMFSFVTSEGVTLYGWMVKPADFDPSRKYPVVMYQYGGPGSQQVMNKWNIGMAGQGAILEHYFAQQGYITVCVDNRGTGGRGAEFEKCTYLQLGELESKDQVETALWIGKQTWGDPQRIGIWGWSFGGWNVLMSMSEGRPVFRAGVAIAPPTSWRYYDTVYTERYMRTPKENPHGYDEVNAMARAAKLSGALLICHGLADDNVHYRNTAEYVEALVQADKDFSQLLYTNRNHGIAGGNTRNHLFRQAIRFFDDNLK